MLLISHIRVKCNCIKYKIHPVICFYRMLGAYVPWLQIALSLSRAGQTERNLVHLIYPKKCCAEVVSLTRNSCIFKISLV